MSQNFWSYSWSWQKNHKLESYWKCSYSDGRELQVIRNGWSFKIKYPEHDTAWHTEEVHKQFCILLLSWCQKTNGRMWFPMKWTNNKQNIVFHILFLGWDGLFPFSWGHSTFRKEDLSFLQILDDLTAVDQCSQNGNWTQAYVNLSSSKLVHILLLPQSNRKDSCISCTCLKVEIWFLTFWGKTDIIPM